MPTSRQRRHTQNAATRRRLPPAWVLGRYASDPGGGAFVEGNHPLVPSRRASQPVPPARGGRIPRAAPECSARIVMETLTAGMRATRRRLARGQSRAKPAHNRSASGSSAHTRASRRNYAKSASLGGVRHNVSFPVQTLKSRTAPIGSGWSARVLGVSERGMWRVVNRP